jgi:hypothetical protein
LEKLTLKNLHKPGFREPFTFQIPTPLKPGQPLEVKIAFTKWEASIKPGAKGTQFPTKVHAYFEPPC